MAAKPKRGAAGHVTLRKLRDALAKGDWRAGLTVLTGDDLYHLDRAQRALLEALVPAESSELALTVYGQETVEIARVVAAARSRPMFAPCRVVLVRDVGALDGEPGPLEGYASDPPGASYLIVRATELDQRRKLHKALVRSGTVLDFTLAGARPSDLLAVVRAMGQERKLDLDRAVVGFLYEIAAGDLQRVAAELDKLRAWIGDVGTHEVTLAEAREVACGSAATSGFEVADAVAVRDAALALSEARRLLDAGQNAIGIVGGLAWRARLMLQAKAMQERGADRRQVTRELHLWSVVADSLFRGLPRYRLDELRRFPALLAEADRTLKSRSIDPRAVLESLVARLTAEHPAEGAGAV